MLNFNYIILSVLCIFRSRKSTSEWSMTRLQCCSFTPLRKIWTPHSSPLKHILHKKTFSQYQPLIPAKQNSDWFCPMKAVIGISAIIVEKGQVNSPREISTLCRSGHITTGGCNGIHGGWCATFPPKFGLYSLRSPAQSCASSHPHHSTHYAPLSEPPAQRRGGWGREDHCGHQRRASCFVSWDAEGCRVRPWVRLCFCIAL